MTDPKEAAVQRLALAYANEGVIAGADLYESIEECTDGPYFLTLARIAIEQGVYPVAESMHNTAMRTGWPPQDQKYIPWDAVCPADAEGEK